MQFLLSVTKKSGLVLRLLFFSNMANSISDWCPWWSERAIGDQNDYYYKVFSADSTFIFWQLWWMWRIVDRLPSQYLSQNLRKPGLFSLRYVASVLITKPHFLDFHLAQCHSVKTHASHTYFHLTIIILWERGHVPSRPCSNLRVVTSFSRCLQPLLACFAVHQE